MQTGVKFRIYPNKEQKNLINQTLGCCRIIYNKGLALRNEAYQKGDKIGYSQTCSCCGYKNPLVKNLSVRDWECLECHTQHDRDTNAGINILNKGLLMQSA